ncbi:restriction endonuclease subunit S [Halobacterium salinarum]|uniref:restriction endonuclease subunit S n=1 Tax=Halobacterium salinarum TaxID=2242 RepID=UPI001F344C36|nr:restriction endonuclease subunit S [Halobacterium salinarum]MCF2237830.1 restriction endonuclease subunit S [Halobacterium salinarum]
MNNQETLGEYASGSTPDESADQQINSRFWGEIPVEWDIADPDQIYEVNPNPSATSSPNTYIEMDALDTELPWPEYFGSRDATEYSGKTFTKGDTLFARITPCTENGKTAIVPEMETEVGIGSTEFAVLSPREDRIVPWFLYYLAKSHPVRNYAISRMRGSTGRQRVPFDVFRRELDYPLPPLKEQRKVASVLHSVDLAIQKSKEIISQTERVRSGVIQDLVEQGLNSEGKLRAAFDAKPSLYEEKNGRTVPSTWSVAKLSDIGDWQSGKTPRKSVDEYWGGSIPWVSAKDMKTLRLSETEDKITESAVDDGAPLSPPDSLLILVRGMILDHTLPIVRPTETVSFNQDVKAIHPNDQVNPDYLAYWLESNSEEVLALVTTASHGTKRLATEALGNLSIPVPPLEEQTEIVDRVREFDNKIDVEKSHVDQLKSFKKGLLQDLLLGDVRTAGKEIDVPDEVKNYEPE